MSVLDEPSTINQWLKAEGPIHLRHSDRPARIDVPAARGIVTAVAVGGAVLIWSFVLARILLWWLA